MIEIAAADLTVRTQRIPTVQISYCEDNRPLQAPGFKLVDRRAVGIALSSERKTLIHINQSPRGLARATGLRRHLTEQLLGNSVKAVWGLTGLCNLLRQLFQIVGIKEQGTGWKP